MGNIESAIHLGAGGNRVYPNGSNRAYAICTILCVDSRGSSMGNDKLKSRNYEQSSSSNKVCAVGYITT